MPMIRQTFYYDCNTTEFSERSHPQSYSETPPDHEDFTTRYNLYLRGPLQYQPDQRNSFFMNLFVLKPIPKEIYDNDCCYSIRSEYGYKLYKPPNYYY